jgi:hypothetical protein
LEIAGQHPDAPFPTQLAGWPFPIPNVTCSMFDKIATMQNFTLKPRIGQDFIGLKVSFHTSKEAALR